jgi:glycosyltransferase involved in cell wall biosynthesis
MNGKTNIIIFILSQRERYRTPLYSENEIFCGPDAKDLSTEERLISIRTPEGLYDSAAIQAKIPQTQKPELIIVKADSTNRNLPVNLACFNCPKILIVGVTHCFNRPLKNLLSYAKQEKFDYISSDHFGHHLHFFEDAGFKVFWSPFLNLNPHPQAWKNERKAQALFVGNLGKFHPYRFKMLNELQKKDIPLKICQLSQEQTAKAYSEHLINLNFSLNGDMNLRNLEIISSGGFLLTDRLSSQTGMPELLTEGVHYEAFGDLTELTEKIEYYLKHPKQALSIARNALSHFQKKLHPKIRLKEFFDIIHSDDSSTALSSPARLNGKVTMNLDLDFRLSLYEYLQDLQLNHISIKAIISSDVNDAITDDLKRLQRINQQTLSSQSTTCDILLITVDELKLDLLKQITFTQLIISAENINDATEGMLRRCGLRRQSRECHIFKWKNFQVVEKHYQERISDWHIQAANISSSPIEHQLALAKLGHKSYLRKVISEDRANEQALNLLQQQNEKLLGLAEHQCKLQPSQKILLITNLYPPQEFGGYGRVMYDFAHCLNKRGHTVEVLTSNFEQFGLISEQENGVNRSLKLAGGWKNSQTFQFTQKETEKIILHNLAQLKEKIRSFQPDSIFWGNIDLIGFNLLEECLNQNIPVIHNLGGAWPGYSPAMQPTSNTYQIVAPSQWCLDKLTEKAYRTQNATVVYPGAKVCDYYTPHVPSFSKLKIIFAGIVQAYKGVHTLIKSLAILQKHGIDFDCTIAGTTTDNDFLGKIKAFCSQQQISDKVHFTGFLNQQQLKREFWRHNILVFPTIVDEAFGISQIEAMASGLLLISSATGGAREVQDENSTLSFTPEDENSLTDKLIWAHKNPIQAQNMSIKGQQRAIEKFDIEKSVDQLESIFIGTSQICPLKN